MSDIEKHKERIKFLSSNNKRSFKSKKVYKSKSRSNNRKSSFVDLISIYKEANLVFFCKKCNKNVDVRYGRDKKIRCAICDEFGILVSTKRTARDYFNIEENDETQDIIKSANEEDKIREEEGITQKIESHSLMKYIVSELLNW